MRLFGRRMAEFIRYAIYSPDVGCLVIMTAIGSKLAVDEVAAP